ncbi:L-histidine N(alpha)-methyltransferase [Nocardia sp. NBC_00565]|uniref:L-histidine N(alpha)-methyltransferase n=1 Tax=Nocardia sp. NBC_00565 TaxID=2975993 RepID=UPI002E7FC1D3|nr:L-histidine N(alpha)-methyltransferase [Nocardia sp. NBC_00565]WUC07628.1 L-histidine N(alpha)-methyltransferase [Nocardia sp. NBC_00565]
MAEITHIVDVQLTEEDLSDALRADVLRGLTGPRKWLPSKWFYDARGSKLFEAITELPEYYPTRTERTLLRHCADAIAAAAAEAGELIELGSGSSEKTRLLLTALSTHGSLKSYLPQDVSESALRAAAEWINAEFPALAVHGVVSDFTSMLPGLPRGGRRIIVLLGGTIGNLTPAERSEFFRCVHDGLEPGEQLLLGVGLVTDPAVMVPAYDDAAGVTAEFNRNILRVLNNRLGADFEPDRFAHIAVWDAEHEWIEMRLEATADMSVTIADLDLVVDFTAGEQLRTEISAKFRLAGLHAELDAARLGVQHSWTDPDDRFALVLAARR